MRKVWGVLLLVLYLSGTVRVVMNMHFCGCRLKSISFNSNGHEKCCCQLAGECDCCKDMVIATKLHNKHKPCLTAFITTLPALDFPAAAEPSLPADIYLSSVDHVPIPEYL